MCRPVFHRSRAPQTMTAMIRSVADQLHLVISGGFLRVMGGGSVPLWAKSRRHIGEHLPAAPFLPPTASGNALVCGHIPVTGALHDRFGERRRLFAAVTIPAGLRRGEPVPDVLLVERRLAPARLPLVGRPEPRRVRREHLV